jgi:hypothetical protein
MHFMLTQHHLICLLLLVSVFDHIMICNSSGVNIHTCCHQYNKGLLELQGHPHVVNLSDNITEGIHEHPLHLPFF